VEKAEKIVQGSGLFFIFKKRPSTHHVSPRISPRSHHKKTTFCTSIFQNTPQKHQQKQQNPGFAPGSHFSLKTLR